MWDWQDVVIFAGGMILGGSACGAVVAAAIDRAARRLADLEHRRDRDLTELREAILVERESRRALGGRIAGLGRSLVRLEESLCEAFAPVGRGGAASACVGIFPHPDEEDAADGEGQDARGAGE